MEPTGAETIAAEAAGLAVYQVGTGEPVLVMPYSHAFTTSPMAEGPVAAMIAAAGRQAVTFDPPGAYRSSRRPRMDVAEMVDCAVEALDRLGIARPVDVVGHSTGAFCAAVLAMRRPERVRSLVLVSPTGVGDTSKLKALPFGPGDIRFWRFYRAAVPVYTGHGTTGQLATVYGLLVPALHADPSRCPAFAVDPGNAASPAPTRSALLRGIPRVGRHELTLLVAPTVIVSGSEDPIVPVRLVEQVAAWMPQARLVIVEGCGHYPQHEAPDELAAELTAAIANG